MEESGSGAAEGYASSGGDSSPSPIASHGTGGGGGGGTGDGPFSGSPTQAAAATDGSTGTGTDPKKLRACEACRGLKVRCEPDPDDGPCRRCKKANRRCVVTAPTRKRQRKTDSRVSELEKKIDALTASLQARTGGGGGAGAAGATTQQDMAPGPSRNRGSGQQERGSWEREVAPWDTGRPADQDSPFQQLITMAGRKRKAMEESTTAATTTTTTISDVGGSAAAAAASAETDDRQPSTAAASVGWPAYTSRSTDGDVVDRGLVPLPLAARLFSRYKTQMVRHLPGVVFPRSTTISELRRAKPVLFLALMAAAAGEDHALQRVLQKELMQIFAQKVMVTGEKSLELVQALNVAVIWYWPPEYFEELKFYQLIHTAAVMAIDIGLGRRTNGRMRRNQGMAGGMSFGAVGGGGAGGAGGAGAGWRGDPLLRNKAPPPDPTSLEARRTWLTCYYLASNTAMSLHRPNLIRWTAFMGESMALLESSADAAPTDKYFCHLVWTHRLGEQIGVQLSMDDDDPDAAAAVDVGGGSAAAADVHTQQALRALDSDLERYKAGVPPARMQATLRIAFDLLKLYMHETVLHADNLGDDDDDDNNGLGASSSSSASQQQQQHHVDDDFDDEARTACLAAINGIFATFLALDVESIRCLPVFNFVRVAYAVVVLLKMYFSASSASSASSLRESMRVQEHLDALLDKFRLTAKEDKCRPASKFLVVLAMLRSWFVKQGRTEGGGGGTRQQQQQQQQTQQTQQTQTPQMQTQTQYQQPVQTHIQTQRVNTPLQLLSEVATGSDPSNPGSTSDPFGYYRQQQQQQPPQQAFFIDPNAAGGSSSSSSSMDYPPWLAEAVMSSNAGGVGGSFYDGVGGEFPTAMGIGAIEGFDAAAAVTGRGGAGMSAATNDQFWTDMFQGIPDPNMFTF
ncbi:hypothetical protein MY10362_001096 [Beauveria mimosiformis]